MPEKKTIARAHQDRKQGQSAATQAGEYVRETMDHIRQGKHGARSTKQAIAIGLSKARRAGVKLAPPRKGQASEATRQKAKSDLAKSSSGKKTAKPSRKRSAATVKALQREPKKAASKAALSRHTHSVAKTRTAAERSASARKAAKTRARNKSSDSR